MRTRNFLLPMVVGAILVAAGAAAQDCVDYGAGVHVTASLPDGARYLVANGDVVYLSSLHTVDVSQPGQPVDQGAFSGPDGTVKDFAISGGFLYAAFAAGAYGSFGGLAIFDLAVPAMPVMIGSIATPGIATAVSAGGGRAYVRSDDGIVTIVDAFDPAMPAVVGSLEAGLVTAFDASGDLVYAFDQRAAMMRVFDTADPAAPALSASWSEPGVQDVELAFGRLYVFAAGAYRVFDLTDPSMPVFAQDLPLIDRVVDFHAGQVDQAAAYGFPAVFWNLTDPLTPVPLATVPFVVHAGFVRGARALVGISDDFTELALGDGTSSGATTGFAVNQAPTGLAVLGSHALVLKEMGLEVLDATDCTAPAPVASLAVPGMNDGYAVVGDHLYILVRAGAGSALQVVDLRDPAAPAEGAFVPVGTSRLQGLTAAGGWLYTARGSVIVPIDVGDPANPVVMPGVTGLGYGPVSAARGNILVAANDWEIRTYSLAQPDAPALLGVRQTDLFGRGLLLDGDTACLLNDNGVALYDVTDPAAITPLGAVAVPGTLDGFTLADRRLYVEGNGIHVVDISDPAAPALVGSLPYGSDTFAPLTAVGGCLWFAQYVSPGGGRIHIAPLACGAGAGGGGTGPLIADIDIKPGGRFNLIDCRRPRGEVAVAILSTGRFSALSVDHASVRFGPGEASESHLLHSRGGRGRGHGRDEGRLAPRRTEVDVDCDGDLDLLMHFRLDDADIPCGATTVTLTGQTYDGRAFSGTDLVQTRGGRGDKHGDRRDERDDDRGYGDCGKALAGADKAAAAVVPRLAPNPFNPMTHVLFSLPQPGRVQVAVYDLSGRRVAVIADSVFAAGDQDVPWAGRDDAGRDVSSGVYFVRIEGAGLEAGLRAVLLR